MTGYLDKIINECGVSKYENIVMSGLDNFILNCSEKILELQDNLSNDTLNKVLYLLVYLYKNWSNSIKKSRINKQRCIKVLFVVLLTGKKIPEWKLLVTKTVNKIAEDWKIAPDDYPFLTNEEVGRIVSLFNAKMDKDYNEIESVAFMFDRTDKNNVFYFIPDEIRNDFIEIYRKINSYPESLKRKHDAEYIKAIFTVIREQDVTKEFPAILKRLPLQFCLMQLHKKLTQISKLQDEGSAGCIVSEKNITLQYEKRLFFKTQKFENYQPIPQWAEWFFLAGQKLAAAALDSSEHIIIGFSLPTRAYAVLFFLLGYETWSSEDRMQQEIKNTKYFDKLSKCQKDEALLILENYHWMRCWFKGLEMIGGDQYIKVEVPGAKNRKHINYVPKNNIAKLRKAVDPERKIATNQTGFKMTGIDSLVYYYKKNENEIIKLLIQERMSYSLFGNVSSLKKEIDQEKLYVLFNGEYKGISFQHILRFKNFMTDFDLPKGIILSNQESIDSYSNSINMVVYDGSLAFINHQQTISGNIEVIFLDRTDPQFSSACGEFMTRYSDRKEDINLFGHQIPDSVELVVFKE